jgi:hypothetical protein
MAGVRGFADLNVPVNPDGGILLKSLYFSYNLWRTCYSQLTLWYFMNVKTRLLT